MKKTKFQLCFVKDFLLSKNIILLDNKYENSNTPLNLQCKVCNHKWKNGFGNIKCSNQRCRKCYEKRAGDKFRLSIDFVRNKCLDKNIILLEHHYINTNTKILCKCGKCNHEWYPTYSNISQGKGCPNYKRINLSKNKRLSHSNVKDFLDSINIELLDIYIDGKTPISCKCKKCNYIWKSGGMNYIKHDNVTCQNCNNKSLYSEKMCRYILESIFKESFIKFKIPSIGVGKRYLELDGYCEKLKLAFEHNGIQHYEPKLYGVNNKENLQKKFEIQQKNDKIKKEWCKENGITLIIIRQLGRYTKEKNIIETIKNQCPLNILPQNFNNIKFDFKEISKKINIL